MKQNQLQSQKQQHKQGYFLSQQHLKLMHLMHLSGYALREYILNEVEQNPVLEVEYEKTGEEENDSNDGEDNVFDSELFNNDDDLFEIKQPYSLNENFYEAPIVQYDSLQEKLKEQIHQLNLSEPITDMACYLIDELDEDGFLRLPLNDVCYDYGFANGKLVEETDFEKALSIVQSCEPIGVGARNLQECLLLQFRHKFSSKIDKELGEKVKLILENYYHHFTQHEFDEIKSELNIQDVEWESIIQFILHLNPKPVTEANKYELMQDQIIPDFEVIVEDEEIFVSLAQNESTRLKINADIPNSLVTHSEKEKKQAENYFSRLVDDGRSLIHALQERETSMMKIITAIATRQPQFFKTGEKKDLRPMILQDISMATGFDVSTISRVTSNKYVQTPHGIYSLKTLFMRNINPMLDSSSQNTAIGIQEEIKRLIESEDKNNPLSDSEIAKLLSSKGITIARRTVVKYREALGIQNSVIRKN